METLLSHSHSVVSYLTGNGGETKLDSNRDGFLKRELSRSHAHIRVRVVDEDGVVRMDWNDEVPIGIKQHLYPEKTEGFTPPEISFTMSSDRPLGA